jgi:hypothetical protein
MKRSLVALTLAAAGAATPAHPLQTDAPRHRPLDPRDALLGIQGSDAGRRDDLAGH